MKSLSSILTTAGAALLFLSPTTTTASPLHKRSYPDVGACSGQCSGRLHDPAVIYRPSTSTYYRFTTNDGINIATAFSIAGPWTFQGPALPQGSSINLPGNHDLWAPDVFEFKETYYLYYSVSEMGSSNSDIGVATSPTLDTGSWLDHGSIGIPPSSPGKEYNRIDGNFYAYDSEKLAMNFGSFWENIFQVEMEDPPIRVKVGGELRHLVENGTVRGSGLADKAVEGGYMFWWEGWHWLFFSSGNCCNAGNDLAPPGEEYHIMVCRSDRQNGGFVDKAGRDCLTGNGGTMVLESHGDVYAPGGQGVMVDPQLGKPVIYYHYVKRSVGYEYDNFWFGWNELSWVDGWPVVV